MEQTRSLPKDNLVFAEAKQRVRCPFCLQYDTELYSLFGQWLSTSQYYCKNCRTVFEWIKWEAERD